MFQPKPTNTWSDVSNIRINCGFKLEKKINGIYKGVLLTDNVAPVSSLLNAYFEECDIRCNQVTHSHCCVFFRFKK